MRTTRQQLRNRVWSIAAAMLVLSSIGAALSTSRAASSPVDAPISPTLSSAVSKHVVTLGAGVSDTITVGQADDTSAAGTWELVYAASPGIGTCNNVDWSQATVVDSGSFTTALTQGQGSTTTSTTVPASDGCYSYVLSLDAGANDPAVANTEVGLASASFVVVGSITPTVVIGADPVQPSATASTPAPDTMTATVTASGTEGATINATWSLYGPAAFGPDGTCATANWPFQAAQGPFLTGTFTINGDGVSTIETPSNFELRQTTGCFSFSVDLAPSPDAGGSTSNMYTNEVRTQPGQSGSVIAYGPTVSLSATASSVPPAIGATLSANAVVTGTVAGFAGSLDSKIFGPVAPGPDDTCASADWNEAPVFGNQANMVTSVTNDGTYQLGQSQPVTADGCYSIETYEIGREGHTVAGAPLGSAGTTVLVGPYLSPSPVTTDSPPTVGGELSDTMVAWGEGSSHQGDAIAWSIYGPTPHGPDGTCASADWSGAPIFDSGSSALTSSWLQSVGSRTTVTLPGCYTFTDSFAVNGNAAAATIAPGLAVDTVDVAPSYGIRGTAFFDTAGDGSEPANPRGAFGIQVDLYTQAGSLVTATLTDDHGNYSFYNLDAGHYYEVFSGLPANEVFSTADPSTPPTPSDSATDANGRTAVFSLAPPGSSGATTVDTPATGTLPEFDIESVNAGISPAPGLGWDWALFGVATQSSTWGTWPGHPTSSGSAFWAIDGNPDANDPTSNVAATNAEENPWFSLDLGSVKSLSHVDVYNRTDCCEDRLSNYDVFTSVAPIDTTQSLAQLVAEAAQPGSGMTMTNEPDQAGTPTTVALPAGTTARYILIELASAGPQTLNLAQVEAYS